VTVLAVVVVVRTGQRLKSREILEEGKRGDGRGEVSTSGLPCLGFGCYSFSPVGSPFHFFASRYHCQRSYGVSGAEHLGEARWSDEMVSGK
jgi:hypothetical protein